jgi:uncharacterized protein YjdB
MATTVNSDLIIYNDQVQTAYLERMQDVLDVFNAASNGALVLRNELLEGDFTYRSMYTVPGSVAHRNVNSDATVSGTKIGADEMIGVKTPWKYGPYEATEESFKRRARSVEEFSQLIGQHMADATLDYMIQAVFAALTAAIGANTAMVAQGDWVLDGKKVLTKGMRKFGDRAGRIVCFAMDSTVYFDMVDQAIDNKIFEEAGFVIYGGTPGTMGKPVLVSDKIPEDSIFGLQAGAAQVVESQAPGVRSYNIDNQENLALGYRAEGTFNIELMGYSWATDGSPAAPSNPNLAQLGSGANWRKYASDNKATAGVLIEVETISPTSG